MAKVLIVDDDRTTVSLLETLLELDGFRVIAAKNGGTAVPIAERERPDIVMIDYHLTDMEGVDVVRAFREHRDLSGIPILMVSGLDVEDKALDAGADRFLVKPFEPADLPRVFKELISD